MVTYSQQIGTEGAALKKGLTPGKAGLFALFIFALALSVAFPYGMGVAVFIWGIALIGALAGAGFAFVTLLQELLGKSAAFGYAPTTAYLAGKKVKRGAPSDEAKKDDK
jgi:hypothetical protein